MNVDIIKDGATLLATIKSLAGRAKKLDNDFQAAILSAVWHFGVRENEAGELIGDVGFINRTYLALGKGARHVAMTEWLLQFGGVMANEGDGKDLTPFIKDKSKKVDLESGAKTPWYNMKPSKKPDEVVDLLKLALAIVKKANGEGKTITHGAMLPELQALCEKYASAGETADATDDDGSSGDESPAGQADPLAIA